MARGLYPGHRLSNGMVPGVKSVGYWDAASRQDWGLVPHRNEGIELTYVDRGHLNFRVENKSLNLNPNTLIVTRPWQLHSIGNPCIDASRLYWIILDVGVRQPHQEWKWPSWMIMPKRDIKQLSDLLRQNEHPAWPGTDEIARCFREIGELVDKAGQSPTSGSRLALLINELFICVLEMLQRQKVVFNSDLTSIDRSVSMFLEHLEDYLEEPWTLESMAEHIGLKRTRFAYYCKKQTNLTPMQYLNYRRIQHAKELMKSDLDRDLTGIGFECGLSSSQYFATVFKRTERISPREFRHQILLQNSSSQMGLSR
jgi:AraC family L-rhamnose operon regulatory protein RhaS